MKICLKMVRRRRFELLHP